MAAKLLHSLADENPDLQKQIGCMTGILQLFDRQHILSGRQLRHRRLPPGTSHLSIGNPGKEYNVFQTEATDMSLNESSSDKQRFNKDLSRASFSSCSSSMSSGEHNKTAQLQASSFDQILLSRAPLRDSAASQSSTSPRVGRQPLDLRDVVKDSMYREARMLSVKTYTNDEARSRSMKHRDSPRPLQLSQSTDGASKDDTNWKQKMPVDLKESLLVLAKLRDAPWYYNEVGEHDKLSHEVKDGFVQSFSRDGPRFSYDGREVERLSFESRDTIRSAPKFKDFPRLSLDSRESSIHGSKCMLKSNKLSKNLNGSDCSSEKSIDPPQPSGSRKHPPSVVAKLMGLEALPGSPLASDAQVRRDPFVSSLDGISSMRPIRTPDSPRNTLKGPTSPRWKNPDLVMKPIPNSKFPVEVAPWRQQDGSRAFHKPALKHLNGLAGSSNPFPSVYSEIEKRLEDLEFKQSGKDLRALKQILDAMQSKGLLETRKEEEPCNSGTQRENESKRESSSVNCRLMSERSRPKNQKDSSRSGESPIVIMKPAKLVEKSGIPASSVIQMDGLPGVPKLQKAPHGKKNFSGNRAVKDTSPENSGRGSGASSTKKKENAKNLRPTHSSSKPQHLATENTVSSIKTSGSVSPRLQQKKAEQDKRSRPPTPPSDTNKTKWKSNRQETDSGSHVGKLRMKSSHVSQMDDQLSEISNESRTLSNQGDDISQLSDSNLSLDSKTDIEVTSSELPTDINGSHGLQMKTSKYSGSHSMENAKLATPALEHPSPVSILDSSMYRDEEPSPSPVKQISKSLKGNRALGSEDCGEYQWSATDSSVEPGLSMEINRKKLQNIDNLVQKLRRLNSHYDEAKTDYIASLCENTDPDNRYISEILLASGLLLRDLGSGLATFQLHPSGHPINPELFFVLEQTKTSSLVRKDECSSVKVADSKLKQEKSHRKLIFDVVNETVGRKLSVVAASPEPWTTSKKLVTKSISAQTLLKELCAEIKQFQTKTPKCNLDDQDDGLKNMLMEDVLQRSESWTDFFGDISNVVLDVERLIFKDLVDEIVYVEAAHLRTKSGRRRQLFT
ncbi:Protein LONGIFOLIA 1, partial [Cucurbita argyrosperma subsp. argyrosperma]|uniref:Protein LONGIFOLIA 1-like n=1 Tax=Cucurbita moschata TaxID=3662 RepID=A0A6J1GSX6_CUCMO